MSINKHISQKFCIQCKGRDRNSNEVLENPIEVIVEISQSPGSNLIASNVQCEYNTGAHGGRCSASQRKRDNPKMSDVSCPYSFDVPYAFDRK